MEFMFWFIKKIFVWEDLSTKILRSLVRDIDLFSWFTDSQIDIIIKLFVLKNYKQWDIVVSQWEKPLFVWIVQDWNLEVFKNIDGSNVKLWEITKNWVYAEMAYFNKTNSMATLRVAKSLISWEISTQNFDKFLSMNPEVLEHIKNVIIQRTQLNNVKIDQVKQETKEYIKTMTPESSQIEDFLSDKSNKVTVEDWLPKIVIDLKQ